MRNFLLLTLVFCLFTFPAIAQHENDNWYFGSRAGISFKNGNPIALTDGQLNSAEGCATMSDRNTGSLLFYTDGLTVWNSKHQVMKNGTGLLGGYSCTQSALIVPNPADSLSYYLFTAPDRTPGFGVTALYYSIVSFTDPNGEVITKNVKLVDNLSEKLTGTLDCDRSGYWVLVHHQTTGTIYAYHLTPNGLDTVPVVSHYLDPDLGFTSGYLKFSPNGKKLAMAFSVVFGANSNISLFDFDNKTGIVSNYMLLSKNETFSKCYGISFSPDNTKLYATMNKTLSNELFGKTLIQQYEVNLSDVDAIINSATIFLNTGIDVRALQLGPDGKLYIAKSGSSFLDVIEKPNLKGVMANYQLNSLAFSGGCNWGLPNIMDYHQGLRIDTVYTCNNSRIGPEPIAGYSYSWSPASGLDNPNVANPTVTLKSVSKYILSITPVNGCTSIQIYVLKPKMVAAVEPVGPICAGSNVRLNASGGTTYTWYPTTGLSNPFISNPFASPSVTTRYTVVVKNNDCTDSVSVVVNVIQPKAVTGADTTICAGSVVQLGDTAKPNETYLWSPTQGLNDPTLANPLASPQVTTRYSLKVTNGTCTDIASVLITVKPFSGANAGADRTICPGSTTVLGSKMDSNTVYLWEPSLYLDDPSSASPRSSPATSIHYILTTSSSNGCIAYDTVFLTVRNIIATVSPDTQICLGAAIRLQSGGGKVYEWSPSAGLNDANISNPLAAPKVTTTYKVVVSDGDCRDSAFVTVKVIPFSGAHAGSDKTICPGGTAVLGEQPAPNHTYKWQPSNDLDDPMKANPTFTATKNGTTMYILTATNSIGCSQQDTVRITVGNIVAKVTNDTAICSGTNVQLLASGGANYTWTPTIGLNNPTIENPIATPTKTTTYKVNVSSGTCEDSAFVTITVNPQPTAKAGQDKTLCIGASTEIGEAAQAGFTYSWQPKAGLDDATKANPTASPTSTTQYILTVTGKGGCTASDTVLVTIGTIKAIVSNDTSICEGASAKIFASGGAKYEWSPSTGLDNPSIADPTANPTITTRYKVLVSSGTCIDSNFVTVTILLPPTANAGEDKSICIGESTQIGTTSVAGNSYSWNPITGLSSPTASQTSASPATTTTYTLQVTNPAGCVKSDEVIVTVNPRNTRSFTMQPDTVTILPGKQFTTSLEIPSGVADWSVKLKYDPLLITYKSITGAQAIPDDLKGELLVNGNGGSRSIPITFDAYLPHTSDTIYPVKLSVDTTKVAVCETWNATGNILMLADYCGKNIRVVSSTGKKYFLTVKDRSIDFSVGLSGNVRLEVFDYVGNSVLVVSDGALEAGEYSAGLDLPVGVYYCRMRAGMYESVGKVLIAR